MARVKKDSIPLNCHIRRDVFNALQVYADNKGMTKTAVVERAIQSYVSRCLSGDEEKDDKDRTESLLSKFSQGNIIYPEVLVRQLNMTKDEAICVLDSRPDLEKIKFTRCPHCLYFNTWSPIPFDEDTPDVCVCSNCDDEYKSDGNVKIAYRVR